MAGGWFRPRWFGFGLFFGIFALFLGTYQLTQMRGPDWFAKGLSLVVGSTIGMVVSLLVTAVLWLEVVVAGRGG